MRIRTSDNRIFEADGALEIVRAMGTGSEGTDADVTRSMWQMAQRVKAYSGDSISVNSPEDFLCGLIRAGLITLEEGEIS